MTEIQTIEGGQKEALLRRANVKKKKINYVLFTQLLNLESISLQLVAVTKNKETKA